MKLNISGKITQYFINSQLTVLLMAATAVLGLFALAFTPREENPQIVVPAANVMVMMPGAGAKEVEELVSKRLESKLWEIPGVEDVYSASMNSLAVVTVKFYVGQDKERSLVKLYDKLMNSMDAAPPGASQPLVKPIDVDDVPIVAATLSGAEGTNYDDAQLRLVADNVLDELRKYVTPESTLKVMVYNRRSWKVLWIVMSYGKGQFWKERELTARYSEAETGCPVTYAYTPEEGRLWLREHGFEPYEVFADHIFAYSIPEYREYRYKKVCYFRWLPAPLFRALEKRFGWHLCLTARPATTRSTS